MIHPYWRAYTERIFYIDQDEAALVSSDATISMQVGKKSDDKTYHELILFDFKHKDFPKQDFMNKIVIESVELVALVNKIPNSTPKQIIVTVAECENTFWYEPYTEELEARLGSNYFPSIIETYEYQVNLNSKTEEWKMACSLRNNGIESVIIDRVDLPKLYSWDVTDGFVSAVKNNFSEKTFVISAFTSDEEQDWTSQSNGMIELLTHEGIGYLNFGKNVIPSFHITYSVVPTPLSQFLDYSFIVLLPVASVIIPVAIWFYKKSRKK